MNKYDIYIGIDPDKYKSGITIFRPSEKTITVQEYDFPDMIELINLESAKAKRAGKSVVVVVEAGWADKSAYRHAYWNDNRAIASAKGYDVGINHSVGMLTVKMCRHWNIPVREQKPLRKIWRGPDRKITNEELQELLKTLGIKGLKQRTNQDVRDSALLALVWSYPHLMCRLVI